jgi:hypothetical protein
MTEAWIGAAGAVVGATITALVKVCGPEIRDALVSKRGGQSLLGEWTCQWAVTDPEDYKVTHIDDTLRITRQSNGEIRGVGQNAIVGSFELIGRYTDFAVSLVWYHSGKNKDLAGAVQLKRFPGPRLVGNWSQLVSTGELIKGQTEWKRV